jgi:hypothetical protein
MKSQTPIKFKLNGKFVNWNPETPACVKIRSLLDKLSDDDLLDLVAIQQKTGVSIGYIKDFVKHRIPEYHCAYRRKLYFGNPKAIARFKDAVKEN